jgi:alpha-galactosidase
MRCIALFAIVAAAIAVCYAGAHVPTVPAMGFNTWNKFACEINETLVREVADALVSSGLAAAGYQFLNLDDCVFVGRDAQGNLIPDPVKFKSGIRALSDYVHSKGLRFGIYTDAGMKTCQGRPGIFGHEEQDARYYVLDANVDYIKIDWCYTTGMTPQDRYANISKAFAATGEPILLSMCEWGVDAPWEWAAELGWNSWRTTGDINASWKRVSEILTSMEGLSKYAKPGHFNDPDMLEVGNGALTHDEQIAHFSLWALMNSPLLLGNDVRSISAETLAIFTNKDVIAVNQDPLGAAGDIRQKGGLLGDEQVWSKPMSDGSVVVALLNKGSLAVDITAKWDAIGLKPETAVRVYDLWLHKDVAAHVTNSYGTLVRPHGVVMVRLYPL